MRDGWKNCELKDAICAIGDHRGRTPPKLLCGKYRVLSAKNIKTGRIVNEESIGYFDDDLYAKYVRLELERGDVIITSEAPFGEVYYWNSDEKAALSQRLFSVRGSKEFCGRFLYYYMSGDAFQAELASRASGTTVMGLRQPELLKCKITYPPLPTQRRIAAVLGALDDKIELNRKMNANLEAQAQALFKSWFVDFDPWGGKMPSGWKKGTAEEFYSIKIGKTPPRKEQSLFSSVRDNNVIWVSIADMGTCGMFVSDSSEYLVPRAVFENNVLVSEKGTVLLSFKLTVGRVSIADCSLSSNEAIAHFSPKGEICKEFTYFYLKEFNYESLGSTSSIATAVNSKMVKAMPFIVPDDDTLRRFKERVEPLSSLISVRLNESRKLAELRDALLPKLMSGELEVA